MTNRAWWDDLVRTSIDAFYEGRAAEGRQACDQLLNVPDLPENVRVVTRTNQVHYAPTLAEIAPGLRETPIDVPVRTGWSRFNPAVASDGDQWLALLRTANYRFNPPASYTVTAAGPDVHTAYLLIRYDKAFQAVDGPRLVTDRTCPADRFPFPVQDYEDCRLVRLGSRWLAVATTRDRNPNGICQIALLDFDPDAPAFSNLRLLSPGVLGLHEKNWMPVVDDGPLALVYSLGPTAILACNPDSGAIRLAQFHDAPYLARDLRGGSQVIPVDEGHLCLVHDVVTWGGGNKTYLHRFVRLDQAFRITDISHPFRFRTTSIEFATGLARRDEMLAIAYGVEDREAWLATVPLDEALDLLRPVADLAPNGFHAFPFPPGLLAVLHAQGSPAAQPDGGEAPVLRPDEVIAVSAGASEEPRLDGITPFPTAHPRLISMTLAGNNQAIISDALRSVVDWVDACLLLDTGITDQTLAIARATAGDKLVVRAFPWIEDFAAARNAALAAAADLDAEWAVTIDTDERIDLRGLDIRAALAATDADVLMVTYADGSYAKERFFRLPARGRYHGPTHEAFLSDGQRADLASAIFSEEAKSAEGYRRKAERDVAILTRHTAAHPDDPRWFYYLGDSLANLGRHEEAIVAFERCWALKGWDEEAAWAMYRAAGCWRELGEHDRAIEACAAGMARHAGLSELPWFAGFIAHQAGRPAQAAYWSRLAAAMGMAFGAGAAVPRIGFRHQPARYEGPYDVLRFALGQLGDQGGADEAERQYQQALALRERHHRANNAAEPEPNGVALASRAAPPADDHLGGYIESGDPETWMPDVWEWVCETFSISSVLDIGCGTAVNLTWFADRGMDVLGVEGHPAAVAAARLPGQVVQHDFAIGPWTPSRLFDLCISTEFVEHVEQRYEPNWIAALRCRYLMMSHALPGQTGFHHVNEQTSEYWIARMEAAGFEHMPAVTTGLRRTCEWRPARHCRNTLLFFRRRGEEADAGAALALAARGDTYLHALEALHQLLRPRAYLEIGVERGYSLKLAQCPAIGVDPEPRLPPELFAHQPPPMIYPMTSDVFFASHRREDLLGNGRLDLAFIDGLHLVEQALRDFANVEAWSDPAGVIVIHDVIPPDVAWAGREPRRINWVGDVWRIAPVLAHYRPDLTTWLVAPDEAQPSGLLIVTRLDPANRVLHDHRAEIEAELLAGNADDSAALLAYLARLECTPLATALAMLAERLHRLKR